MWFLIFDLSTGKERKSKIKQTKTKTKTSWN